MDKMNLIVGVTILLLLILFFILIQRNENFKFRAVNKKNSNICKNYYLNLYRECVRNSGGIDIMGNCFDRIQPNLIKCYFNQY